MYASSNLFIPKINGEEAWETQVPMTGFQYTELQRIVEQEIYDSFTQ